MPLPAGQGVSGTQPVIQNVNANAFTLNLQESRVVITNAAASTITVPVPTTVQDDFVKMEIFSVTAFAHVLSFGANVLNGNKTSATWTKAVAGKIGEIISFGGKWYFTSGIADAAAFAQQITLA